MLNYSVAELRDNKNTYMFDCFLFYFRHKSTNTEQYDGNHSI